MTRTHHAVFFIVVAAMAGAAQIPVRSIPEPSSGSVPKAPFDSTRNFQGSNPDAYVGHTVCVRGMPLPQRDFGYAGFFTRIPQSAGDSRAIYKRGAPLNRFNSRYDALANRCFAVVGVARSAKGTDPTYPRERIFLTLSARDNSETLYFEYDPRHEHLFPFVVQGYFEKLRRMHEGRRFLVRRTDGIGAEELANPTIRAGDTVQCTGMFLEDRRFSLVAALRRSDGQELLVPPERLSARAYLLDLSEADVFRREFGDEAFGYVLRGQVQPGMTRRMCEVAWGPPSTVNRIVHQHGVMEQWVYGPDRAVYFENGLVSSVQNDKQD